MRRYAILLGMMLVAGSAWAGITFRTAADCTTTACTSSSPTFCQKTPYTSDIYTCDTSTGFYAIAGTTNSLIPRNARIVHICDSGCEYTSLNSACAGETSTAANPITYRIHAGVYNGEASCSGEDHASFVGDGQGVTVLRRTGASGCNGTLELGTSSNITITGITFKDGHRQVWWDATGACDTSAGVDHGTNYIFDNEFITENAAEDEDCFFFWTTNGTAGNFYISDNVCKTFADGFTFANDADGGNANINVYSQGNRFFSPTTTSQRVAAFQFDTIPCYSNLSGDQIYFSGTKGAAGVSSLYGYSYLGTTSPNCSSNATAIIQAPIIRSNNTASNGQDGRAYGILIEAGATELTTVRIMSPDITATSTDSTTGDAYGIYSNNATAAVNVIGGRARGSGGAAATTADLRVESGQTFTTLSFDYVTEEAAGGAPTAISVPDISVTNSVSFTGATTISTTADSTTMLTIDNTDEAATETSPYVIIKNSTVAAGDDQWALNVGSDGRFKVYDDSFNTIIDGRQGFAAWDFYLDQITIRRTGATVSIGDGGASDVNRVYFDAGTTDGILTWSDTGNEFVFSGPTDSTGGVSIDDNMGLRLYEEDAGGTNYVELKGGATLAANVSGLPVTGSAVDTHGILLWGDSSDAFDTGTEVCAARALTCVDVKTVLGVDSDCATDQGAATTHFYVLCK